MTVSEFYSKEATDYDAKRWHGPIGRYVAAAQERLALMAVQPNEMDKVLEVGCGTGRFTKVLASSSRCVTAVDISPQMLDITEGKLGQFDLADRVELSQCDCRSLPFEDETFDKVITVNMINHVEDYEQAVREAARVVKIGGTVTLGYPSLYGAYFPYAAIVNLARMSLRRGVYTKWISSPRLFRFCKSLNLNRISRFGQFHCPPLGSELLQKTIVGPLAIAGRFCERGQFARIAPTQFVTFVKS